MIFNGGIGFIGAGKAGTALAVSLVTNGYNVKSVYDIRQDALQRFRRMVPGCRAAGSAADCAGAVDLLFITTPDDVIQQVTDALEFQPGQSVAHCSGVLSLDVLLHAKRQGALTASVHPMQSFADSGNGAELIEGSYFGIECDDEGLRDTLGMLVRSLGGKVVPIDPGSKALYHAAAVVAGNYTTTLVYLAAQICAGFGMDEKKATEMLVPLMRGTLENVRKYGVSGSLTGPKARGDVETIKRHVEALRRYTPEILPLYCHLGLATLPIALEQGSLTADKADELKLLLKSGLDEVT